MTAVLGIGEGFEGKYRVLLELGQGGTAHVYLAVARGPGGFNKLVVLKALKKDLADDPEFRNMFLNEARLAARLNHPNIVQTNEVVEEEGVPMIVMEYLEGQAFSNILVRGRKGQVPLAMNLRIVADALGGLHAAHELTDFDGTPLGVVHRDMTPHNVFVTFEGQVKVLDFGIAKLGASLIETQAGIIKGKLRYMPPEQIAGNAVDRRADVYAAGVMLWEVAAGERLWKGYADAAIMNKVLSGEVPSPRSVNPQVPDQLEQICMKALSPDREQRHATAAELELALETFLSELGATVTNRQIGKTASGLFEDVRAKTKSLVDAQLSKVVSLTWAEYQSSQVLSHAPTMTFSGATAMTGTVTGSGSGQVSAIEPASRRGGSNNRTLALAFAVVLAGGLLFWKVVGRESDEKRGPEAASSSVPAGQAGRPDKPGGTDRVFLRMSAVPVEAKLFLDDEPLPANPFARTMPADSTQHTIRAEAAGYSPSSSTVVLDKDTDVVLSLERSNKGQPGAGSPAQPRPAPPSPPPARPRPGPVTAPATPPPATVGTPPAPAPAKPDCNPPYFIDGQGIKKYRPECM